MFIYGHPIETDDYIFLKLFHHIKSGTAHVHAYLDGDVFLQY